jgi:large subunit ribosomal protein L17
MRHKKDNKRLGRPTAHREAMLTNLLQSLVKHGRITTTLVRAKELQRLADRIVTIAKRRTAAAYAQLTKYIKSERELLIPKLMEEIAPKFAERKGGYTRVVKLGFRRGDAAPTAIIEYLSEVIAGKPVAEEVPAEEKKETKAKKPAAKKAPAKKEEVPKKEAKAKKEEKEPAKKKSAKKKEE